MSVVTALQIARSRTGDGTRVCKYVLPWVILDSPSATQPLDPYYIDLISRGPIAPEEFVARHKILVAATPSYLDTVLEDVFSSVAKSLQHRVGLSENFVSLTLDRSLNHPAGTYPPARSFTLERISGQGPEPFLAHADGRYTRMLRRSNPDTVPPTL